MSPHPTPLTGGSTRRNWRPPTETSGDGGARARRIRDPNNDTTGSRIDRLLPGARLGLHVYLYTHRHVNHRHVGRLRGAGGLDVGIATPIEEDRVRVVLALHGAGDEVVV